MDIQPQPNENDAAPVEGAPLRWAENERDRAEEAKATEEALRTGAKTTWQIQEENSFIPWGAEITIDFEALSRAFEEEYLKRDRSLPNEVPYRRFPTLNQFCWNLHEETIPAEDAYAIYVDNWGKIDPDVLNVEELALIRDLNSRFGSLLPV